MLVRNCTPIDVTKSHHKYKTVSGELEAVSSENHPTVFQDGMTRRSDELDLVKASCNWFCQLQ